MLNLTPTKAAEILDALKYSQPQALYPETVIRHQNATRYMQEAITESQAFVPAPEGVQLHSSSHGVATMPEGTQLLDLVCEMHNMFSPRAIHLAIVDMEDVAVATPDIGIVDFMTKLRDAAQARDNEIYDPKPEAKGRTYQIAIDERQRDMITHALADYKPAAFEPADHEERKVLCVMFEQLADVPDEETGSRMLHGFCL